jgi:hypothetical protein
MADMVPALSIPQDKKFCFVMKAREFDAKDMPTVSDDARIRLSRMMPVLVVAGLAVTFGSGFRLAGGAPTSLLLAPMCNRIRD